LVPSQANGAHEGTAVPAATAAHVPVLHVAQGPVHDVLQQIPATQVPLAH
jgi:hypothetical protein